MQFEIDATNFISAVSDWTNNGTKFRRVVYIARAWVLLSEHTCAYAAVLRRKYKSL